MSDDVARRNDGGYRGRHVEKVRADVVGTAVAIFGDVDCPLRSGFILCPVVCERFDMTKDRPLSLRSGQLRPGPVGRISRA